MGVVFPPVVLLSKGETRDMWSLQRTWVTMGWRWWRWDQGGGRSGLGREQTLGIFKKRNKGLGDVTLRRDRKGSRLSFFEKLGGQRSPW